MKHTRPKYGSGQISCRCCTRELPYFDAWVCPDCEAEHGKRVAPKDADWNVQCSFFQSAWAARTARMHAANAAEPPKSDAERAAYRAAAERASRFSP